MPAKTARKSRPGRRSAGRDKAFEALVGTLKALAQTMNSLSGRAVVAYAPVVEDLVLSRSRDIRRIEETLDDLLSFCGYAPALDLYKALCRHYLSIDPTATADYVSMYRDMWDADGSDHPLPRQADPVRTRRGVPCAPCSSSKTG